MLAERSRSYTNSVIPFFSSSPLELSRCSESFARITYLKPIGLMQYPCNTALCAYSKPRNIFESGALRLLKNISVLLKASIGCKLQAESLNPVKTG
jgi:hypothetical protein